MKEGRLALILVSILWVIILFGPKVDATLETIFERNNITTDLYIGAFFGNGSGSLNVTNVTGTTTWNAAVIVNSFISNNLTVSAGSLNASIIDSGSLSDNRLSSNILFANGSRNMSADLKFNAGIGIVLAGGNITSNSEICIGSC